MIVPRRFAWIAVAVFLFAAGSAFAQQQTSRSTFAKIVDVQKLIEAEQYGDAIIQLQALAERTSGKNYDQAVALQYLAHTAVLADRPELARPALEKAVALSGLPEQFMADLKLYYGQIVMGDEEYEFARQLLEAWYGATQDPVLPSQVFSLAYANYRAGDLPRAEVLLPIAIEAQPNVNESWYRVYYQVLFEQKKYQKAEATLYELATRYPDNEDAWRLLANHYLQVEDSKRAVSAMAIADQQGLLEGEEDQRRLSSMYAYVAAPEKAARILEETVAQGEVELDGKTLRRLADLWLLSRDREKALSYLERAAAVAPDGKTYELLGSLLFEDARWADAQAAFGEAVEAGGLEDEPRIHLLAGISAAYAGNDDAARGSLQAALESPKHRAQAQAMLQRLDNP